MAQEHDNYLVKLRTNNALHVDISQFLVFTLKKKTLCTQHKKGQDLRLPISVKHDDYMERPVDRKKKEMKKNFKKNLFYN